MRRTLITCAGVAALAITLTACGDSGGSSTSGGSASTCTATGSSLTVHGLDKLTFDAKTYEAAAGCVEISYVNDGSVAHSLLVKGQKGFKLSIGKTDSGELELAAGTYTLYCDIAGHEAAGMHAELTVT